MMRIRGLSHFIRGVLPQATRLLLAAMLVLSLPAWGQEKAAGASAKPGARDGVAPDAQAAAKAADAKAVEVKADGVSAAPAPSGPQLPPAKSPLSETRLQLLARLVAEFYQENPQETSEFRLVRTVLAKFAETDACPQAPRTPVLTDRDIKRAAASSTSKMVAERFPAVDEKVWEDEAVAEYPIYKEGEIVTVKYQPNPARPAVTKRSYFQGRKGDVLLIGPGGGSPIRVEDVAAVPENKAELLKFDRNASIALRKAHVEARRKEYDAKRAAFEEALKGKMLSEEQKWGIATNEKNGYVLKGGQWLKLKDALLAVAAEVRERMGRSKAAAQAAQLQELDRLAGVAIAAQAAFDVAPAGRRYRDPELLYAELKAEQIRQQEEATRLKEEAEAKAKSDAEAAEAKAKADAEAAEARAQAEAEAAARKRQADEDIRITLGGDKSAGFPIWLYAAIALALGVGGAVTFFLVRKYSTPDPQKFFQAKGKMQKNFWAMAEANPERFKYCAYRFPNPDQGRSALLSLSYMQDASGQLKCKRANEVLFGVYPHQDKAVAFLGGEGLGYAMWREATAVWPELPGAEYFRVSTAPDVALEVPNIQDLMADSKINITFVERKEAADYTMHHIYKAPDEESAMAFLEKVEIKSADVRIVVHTPTATFRKSVDGLVKDEPDKDGAAGAAEARPGNAEIEEDNEEQAPTAERGGTQEPVVAPTADADKADDAEAGEDDATTDAEEAGADEREDESEETKAPPAAAAAPPPKTAASLKTPVAVVHKAEPAPAPKPLQATPAAASPAAEHDTAAAAKQTKTPIAILPKAGGASKGLKLPDAASKIVVPPPGTVAAKPPAHTPAKVAPPAPRPAVATPPKAPETAAPEGETKAAEPDKPEAQTAGAAPKKSLTLIRKKAPGETKK